MSEKGEGLGLGKISMFEMRIRDRNLSLVAGSTQVCLTGLFPEAFLQ